MASTSIALPRPAKTNVAATVLVIGPRNPKYNWGNQAVKRTHKRRAKSQKKKVQVLPSDRDSCMQLPSITLPKQDKKNAACFVQQFMAQWEARHIFFSSPTLCFLRRRASLACSSSHSVEPIIFIAQGRGLFYWLEDDWTIFLYRRLMHS